MITIMSSLCKGFQNTKVTKLNLQGVWCNNQGGGVGIKEGRG